MRPSPVLFAIIHLLALGFALTTTLLGAEAHAEVQAPLASAPAPAPPYRAPYEPSRDDEVLQDVPATADPAVARMMTLRKALDAAPHDLPTAISLAGAYVDYGRQVGDAHYAGYAEAVIAPWLAAQPVPSKVLVTEANILQYRHQFPEARKRLHEALSADPGSAQAWLTLATLDMVQGDYATAGKDCVQVTSTADVELGLACSANLRSYTGHARQSLALLDQVQAAAAGQSPAYRAWVHGLSAEAAERLGDWPLAETHYKAALQLLPRDNFLLVAYADFLLDRSRPREVLPLLADAVQSDTAFLRIALAQAALKSPDTARYTWIMAARFAALTLRGSDFFGREQARFALELQHDPQTALDLARKNWQVQREPWDTRLLLEAAVAAQEPRAVSDVLEFRRRVKLEDPVVDGLVQELRAADTVAASQP
jgi:tetratricopeptide (TPR) repeat protein